MAGNILQDIMAGNLIPKINTAIQEVQQGKTLREVLTSPNPGFLQFGPGGLALLKQTQAAPAYKRTPPTYQKWYTKIFVQDLFRYRGPYP